MIWSVQSRMPIDFKHIQSILIFHKIANLLTLASTKTKNKKENKRPSIQALNSFLGQNKEKKCPSMNHNHFQRRIDKYPKSKVTNFIL